MLASLSINVTNMQGAQDDVFATWKASRGLTFVAEAPDYCLYADDRGQLVRVYESKPADKSTFDRLLAAIDELANLDAPARVSRRLGFERLER